MNRSLRKKVMNLFVCLLSAFLLIGCSSASQDEEQEVIAKGQKEGENMSGKDKKLELQKQNVKDGPSGKVPLKKKLEPGEAKYLQSQLDIKKEANQLSLSFTLENISNQGQTLTFSSGQQFDFLVYNENNELIYQWSKGRFFTMGMKEITVDPGGQLKYDVPWGLTNQEGEMVPDGKYTIEFRVTASAKAQDGTSVNPDELWTKQSILSLK